jgi:hypothetical protein
MAVAVWAGAGCGGSGGGPARSASQPAGTAASSSAAGTTSSSVAAASSSGTAGAGETVTGSAGGVVATMRAGTHRPRVGQPWLVHFTATRAGSGVVASVGYEFLFAGHVVARRSHFTFNARFSDNIEWPASAVGYALTFRAVVGAAGATIDLDYPVQVVK